MTSSLLVLRAPSANRVYTAAAGALTAREAHWVLGAHLGAPVPIREREIAGLEHLEIRAEDTDSVRGLLATLSSAFAVFAPQDGASGAADVGPGAADADEPLLRPVRLPHMLRHGSELETTLRYPGKTNEQFTALLVNLAAALSTRRARLLDGELSLLDPTCGRGTTLNRALRLGLSPTGADLDRKDLEAYRAFLVTWAKQRRLPHTQSSGRLRIPGQSPGSRWDLELAADRAAQRAGDTQGVHVLTCDTTHLDEVLPSRSVDSLVADLPYGVQHGARTESWQRSPLDLLQAAAPAWRSLLRDGGGMALALNRRTAPYESVRGILGEHGLEVVSRDGEFRHRVDQSIDRDVVLAVPSSHPQRERLHELAALSTTSPT
jgi:hypothetical protein